MFSIPYEAKSFKPLIFLIFFLLFLSIRQLVPYPIVIVSPFIILSLYHLSLKELLWISFFLGLGADLFSEYRFGTNALSYVLISAILYYFKSIFLSDSPAIPFVMGAFYSLLYSILLTFLAKVHVDSVTIFKAAVCNGLYCSVLFFLPRK
jgi:rod shape-determining protein MreD